MLKRYDEAVTSKSAVFRYSLFAAAGLSHAVFISIGSGVMLFILMTIIDAWRQHKLSSNNQTNKNTSHTGPYDLDEQKRFLNSYAKYSGRKD